MTSNSLSTNERIIEQSSVAFGGVCKDKVRKNALVASENHGENEEKRFFCLTLGVIFSNQPADFLKQLMRSEPVADRERFMLAECQK